MTASTNQRVTVKLFVGYLMTSDIRMYLKQSSSWKQAKILKEPDLRDLLETHFQDRDYIGKYISHSSLTISELRTMESSIHQSLLNYCPELSQETLKIYVFPQVFIS